VIGRGNLLTSISFPWQDGGILAAVMAVLCEWNGTADVLLRSPRSPSTCFRLPPLRSQDRLTAGRAGLLQREGRHRPSARLRAEWKKACAAAGAQGVRPEWLRHTGASLAHMATKDMKAVAARLGHTSTRMMGTVYVEIYPEASRSVADAIDALVRAASHAE
jgi:integrase